MGWGVSCLVGWVVHPVEAPRVTLGWFPPCFVGCKKYPRVYYTHIPSRPRKGAGFATPEDPTKTGKSTEGPWWVEPLDDCHTNTTHLARPPSSRKTGGKTSAAGAPGGVFAAGWVILGYSSGTVIPPSPP